MYLSLTKYSLFLLWVLTATTSWAASKQALSPLPDEVIKKWDNFSLVGQTTLRVYGFHVYDSSFWTIDDKLSSFISDDFLATNTHALSITYARKISLQKLLSSTKKEWQRLGFTYRYPLNTWLSSLENIWTTVGKGDQLIAVVTAQGKTKFFNSNTLLGTIDNENFGPAFLSIWIDKNSRFKKNSRELLGE